MPHAGAAEWQTDAFLKSIKKTGQDYDFQFWREGLKSVYSLSFKDGATNQYRPFLNRMILGSSMSDGADRIKSWDQLNAIDLGTLAHESWHAYHHNFIDRDDRLSDQEKWLHRRAPDLYWRISRHKADAALDEAYALFIGSAVTTHRWIKWSFKRFKDGRDQNSTCEKLVKLAKGLWERNWDLKVEGYYYRDQIWEYWIDHSKEVFGHLIGSDKYDLPPDGAIFTKQSITNVDRDWISENIFEGRWTRDFNSSFSKDLKESGCKL